jgi:hypothetical protein
MGENYVLGTRDDDSVFKPTILHTKMFEERKVVMMGTGTQHAVALVLDTPESKIPELDTSKFVVVPTTIQIDKVRIDSELPDMEPEELPEQQNGIEETMVTEKELIVNDDD